MKDEDKPYVTKGKNARILVEAATGAFEVEIHAFDDSEQAMIAIHPEIKLLSKRDFIRLNSPHWRNMAAHNFHPDPDLLEIVHLK